MQKLRKFAKRLKMNRYNKGFPEDKEFKLTFRFSAIKSIENTTYLRLFSFLPASAFDRFLLNFSLVSRNFSSNRKSQKPLIHKGLRDFCSGRFLEIFFVCVVRTIFSMKTQIVFIFIATDLAFCPAQYNPICIEHRC